MLNLELPELISKFESKRFTNRDERTKENRGNLSERKMKCYRVKRAAKWCLPWSGDLTVLSVTRYWYR